MACGCSNIAIMQLFHRLKQDFPAAPDEVVMQCIRQHAHDSEACERALRRLQGGRGRVAVTPPAFMVHTHADAHACPMTGTAGMPLHGHPTANHSGPAGPGRGQGPGKGGCGHDDSPVAEMSALHIAAPPAPDSRMTAKSTASFQWAPRKRRPAPPPPTAAASSSAAATPVASPAASPAPSPRPSPRPSPTPSRPAPPPPVPASLRRPADGASGPGEGAFHAANVADRNCRAPSPVPPVRPVSPVPHGPALAPSYPSSGQTSGSQLQVPQAHYLASGPAPRPPLGPQPAGPQPVVHQPAGPQPAGPQPVVHQPTGPQPAGPRHTASMDIQPVAPYGVGVVPPRSYTSVNLTLRPPSEQPQAPIDIISEGSSLTYSTSSYDPRQGYQSQLQICIGPNGLGSVSAMRTRAPVPPLGAVPPVPPSAALRRAPPRPPAPSLAPSLAPALEPLAEEPARTAASREELERMVVAMGAADLSPEMREHLVRQLERRMLLETELHKERTKLQLMQKEVAEMERDLQRRSAQARPRAPPALPVMEKVQRLRNEIQTLQEECTRMANEVDAKTPQNNTEEGNNEPGWTCQTCTFHNYYLLEACETCDVPRMRLGSDNNLSGPSGPAGLHALGLSGFPPSSILPSLASPALDAALAPLALAPTPTAMCVPNMLFPSPGHEE